MKNRREERVILKFDRRCPYCDHPLSIKESRGQVGERPITCPSCQKTFIKVVPRWTARETRK